MIYTFW